MPKFVVEYSYTTTEYDSVEVEAESAEEAEEIALTEVWADEYEIIDSYEVD